MSIQLTASPQTRYIELELECQYFFFNRHNWLQMLKCAQLENVMRCAWIASMRRRALRCSFLQKKKLFFSFLCSIGGGRKSGWGETADGQSGIWTMSAVQQCAYCRGSPQRLGCTSPQWQWVSSRTDRKLVNHRGAFLPACVGVHHTFIQAEQWRDVQLLFCHPI